MTKLTNSHKDCGVKFTGKMSSYESDMGVCVGVHESSDNMAHEQWFT